jgi:hypothetical protein
LDFGHWTLNWSFPSNIKTVTWESEGNDLFCPKCKAEYKPGYYECADCGEPLVHELTVKRPLSAEEEKAASLVQVFSTYSQADIMLVKAYLDAEEIPYHLQGELYSGSGIYITPVTLYVARSEADRVVEMLRDHGLE